LLILGVADTYEEIAKSDEKVEKQQKRTGE
jgi:hypothetical protein